MKDVLMVILSALVTISMLSTVNTLEHVTNELKYIQTLEVLQNPVETTDVAAYEIEQNYTDAELVEILGL